MHTFLYHLKDTLKKQFYHFTQMSKKQLLSSVAPNRSRRIVTINKILFNCNNHYLISLVSLFYPLFILIKPGLIFLHPSAPGSNCFIFKLLHTENSVLYFARDTLHPLGLRPFLTCLCLHISYYDFWSFIDLV